MLATLGTALSVGVAGLATALTGGCTSSATVSGSYGCDAVVPPVYLSEAEARAVIIEEAKKGGIDFKEGGPALQGVAMDVYLNDKVVSKEKVKADGCDSGRHIAFVFVSRDAAARWTSGNGMDMSQYAEAADKVIKKQVKVAKAGQKVGTFYEPFTCGGDTPPAKLRDKEDLRKQVREFVHWLKAQGVI